MKNFIKLFPFILFLSACDPCDIAAHKICDCIDSVSERKECKQKVSLAHGQKFFSKARDVKVCEEVLKNCTCLEINNKNHEKCGGYRYYGSKEQD